MHVPFHSIMACGQPEYGLTPNTCFSLKKKGIVFLKDLAQWFYSGHVQEAEVISETVSLKISVAFLALVEIRNL